MAGAKQESGTLRLNGHGAKITNILFSLLFAAAGFLGREIWDLAQRNADSIAAQNSRIAEHAMELRTASQDHDDVIEIKATLQHHTQDIEACRREMELLRQRLSRFEGTALGLGIKQEAGR